MAEVAPAFCAASRMDSSSWSFRPGMTGAKPTPTGTPVSARRLMASSRLVGVEARGSIARARPRSRVVMDIMAEARPSRPMGPRMSASRVIRTDLVMMLNG
ncbi:hypothetical protein D3C72_2216270 [compost metagenome]